MKFTKFQKLRKLIYGDDIKQKRSRQLAGPFLFEQRVSTLRLK